MKLNITQLQSKLFKNEAQLREHIAENLHLIEPGLRLYKEKGVTGKEVPCRVTDWGRQGAIDILAVDEQDNFVVIECKHKYGDGMAFGQLLGYMAWIKRRLSSMISPLPSEGEGPGVRVSPIRPTPSADTSALGPQPSSDHPSSFSLHPSIPTPSVRGVIVARRANPLLRLLLNDFPNVGITVYEFQDSTTLTRLS
jgi:hypothetical protein